MLGLKGGAREKKLQYIGTYERSTMWKGKPTWVSDTSTGNENRDTKAIWYLEKHNEWIFGDLEHIGKPRKGIKAALPFFIQEMSN